MNGDLITPLWQARTLPALSPRGWEQLLAQSRSTLLTARLALLLQDRGWWQAVPPAARQHLANALVRTTRQHRQTQWEVDRLVDALQGLPGPIVLLKGAAYAVAQLPPARGRLFTDIDVMLPQAQLPQAEGQLLAAGWVPEPLDPYDARYYRQWMHELPPLKHVWRHSWIDLHHTIAPPTSRFRVDGARLLARAVPVAPGSRVHVLAPEDMVLHSCVHLMSDGDYAHGLRDLLDLRDLVDHHHGRDAGFWPRLQQRAAELGLQGPLAHVSRQLQRRLGVAVPAAVSQALQDSQRGLLTRWLMPRLLDLALLPAHPSCDSRAAAWARGLLYVRSHWLRMPWYQIVPHLLRKAWRRAAAPAAAATGGAG